MKAPLVGRVVLLASVVLLLVSGCAKEMTQPSTLPEESSSTGVSESTGPSADEQAIIAAYKGYFETLLELGTAGDSQIRQMLAPYAEGVAVERIVKGMANYRAAGQEPGGTIVFSAIQVAVSGDTASTTECRDGTTEAIVDSATKATISPGVPQTLISGRLVKNAEGAWLVADYDAVAGSC